MKEIKEIKAYIKPHRLSKVTLALHKIDGLTGMSVVDVRGFCRGRGKDASTASSTIWWISCRT